MSCKTNKSPSLLTAKGRKVYRKVPMTSHSVLLRYTFSLRFFGLNF